MDITLVTSSFDKLVHGTENEKKTGCGINLLKPENVTRFHRTSQMTDLKEITCEKCKANLAKKLIKADKKEMALLLKEEKKREKLGMNDAGIVPLGNTTARITRDPDAKRKEEEARKKALEEQRKAAEEKRAAEAAAKEAEEQELYNQFLNKDGKNVPSTGVPMDESLAQFAINAPNNEAQAPAPAPANAPAAEDDFLAQFAINKPGDTAASAPAAAPQQDDFLAQFAIPTPEHTQNTDTAPYYNAPNAPQQYNAAPQQPVGGYGYEQPVIPEPVPAPQPVHSDEDIMNLFSINNGAPVQEEPVYGQPVYGQPVIYDGSQPLYDAQGNLIQGVITPVDEYADAPVMNIPQDTAWDYVADQFFGGDAAAQGSAVAAPDGYENVQPGEMADLDIPTIGDITAPVIDDIGAAIEAASKPYGGVPGGLNTPVHGDTAAPVNGQPIDPNTAYMYGDIPLVEDIVAPENDVLPSAASVAAEALSGAPTVDDITAPEFDELPSAAQLAAEALNGAPTVDDITAPEFDELPSAAQLAAEALSGAPTVDDITAPELDELPTIEDIAAQGLDDMQIPVLDDITAPIYNAPYMAEEEFEFNMSDYNNFDANAQNPGAEQPQQAQPQIVKVPQFAGYDANNQPVYKYVPMRLMGYDQNGKPVFAPLNAQPQQAAPAQQTAAQAQRAAAAPAPAPVQQAPAKSIVPKKPVPTEGVPTANISKIAVNPHAKSTSQAFIKAISSSREYADKNLIETQGLQANSPILNSVEDVLSTMGDDSAKKRQLAQSQQNVPVFDEYKAPASSSYNRRNNASPRLQQSFDKDVRYMTKSELKAKKKQDKIDAKFRKEMNKRGF